MFDGQRKPSINIKNGVSENDITKTPVLVIGQKIHLLELNFHTIKCKFGSKVSEEDWYTALKILETEHHHSVPLYLNKAVVASLPTKISRYNTPSRAHSISELVKSKSHNKNECVVIVCEKANIFASVCAVARSYPSFNRKTSGSGSDFTVTIEILVTDDSENIITTEVIFALNYAIEGIRLSSHIVDSPADEMNVDAFVKLISSVAKELNIEPKILRGKDLEEHGFGGIYGVGKAATHPPAFVVLSHKCPGATENIAWVGKGIVFDTGGLGLKGKLSMVGMKRDCGGAAAILGAFYATVKLGFSANLHALFCLAENAIGPEATKPDDIHKLYSGRTVEINNTDAEGRLVLGDGVSFAVKTLQCTTVVDMATLTGAQGVATGRYHGALVTNNEEWEERGVRCGRISGDLLHPLPFSPELHFSEFNSTLADMKNSVNDRSNATSSCAGLFIFAHIGFDWKGSWVHIDMASPVHNGERATGYGVALLMTMFSSYSSNNFIETLTCLSHNIDGEQDGSMNKKMKIV